MSTFQDKLYEKNQYLALIFLYLTKIKNNLLFFNSVLCLKSRFRKRLNRELNLTNPEYYNDKLQRMKLKTNSLMASLCVDKYECRNFVASVIGEEYLNQLYGVYDRAEDIRFEDLPESFVLKCTHGSGMNIICKNKSIINISKEKNKLWCWLRLRYHMFNKENIYKRVKPRVECEKFLSQEDGEELRDYRFFCFNGSVEFIAVDFNIVNKKITKRNLYDLQWNLMDEEISYPKNKKVNLIKPDNLDKMIILAEKLAKYFEHVRVDFYNVNSRIIFGEMTFYHQSGCGVFRPLSFEKKLGSLISINN